MTGKQPETPSERSDPQLDPTRLITGATVTYFVVNPAGTESFAHAVATGPEIVDPRTHDWWAPVRLPDNSLELLPSTLVVGVMPKAGAGEDA
jgi:hypothetical protein